ncbi:transmembrane protein, putative [Medicago truncatula]|uniref:Transmembrane protein, putative n=1 Tax=Medicago truncatula TaxID=3880 RepID=A0A072VF74_MEDTR|nr:transmembrane protein, putative [Medicago truncatula]
MEFETFLCSYYSPFTETLVHVYEGLCALAIPLWMSLVHGSAVLTKCCRLCLKGFNIQGVWVSHGLNFMWIRPYWWRFLLKEIVVVLVGGDISATLVPWLAWTIAWCYDLSCQCVPY